MFSRLRQLWSRDLIRPLLHRAFTRFIWGLFLSLFFAFLISRAGGPDTRSSLLLLFALLGLLGAWLSHLQLDGVKMPRLDWLRTKIDRKRPARGRGDMIDFVDEEVQSYESLDPEERFLVLLLADLICAALFLLLSLLL